MKLPKGVMIALIFAMALLVSSVSAGNGIDLNGPHYNLNLIGMKNTKNMPTELDNGHVIFVKMGKNEEVATRIYLSEGPEQVIDKDGTDGVARFQLPQPYPDGFDVNGTDPDMLKCFSSYQVYVRVLGTPGGHGNITTGVCNSTGTADAPICNESAGNVWMSTESVPLSSHGNDGKFVQVTRELTTVVIGDTRYGLFSDNIYGDLYFWELFNDGMKLVQLRFYPTPEGYCT
jgi:sorbitol-specific phosphotransferase system component IIA